MPRFRFKLDPLLRLRRCEEQERQRVVAELERQRLAVEDRLRRQQQFISTGRNDLRGELTGTLDLTAMRQHASSTLTLISHANRLVLELAGLHQRIESARADLIEATRRRRAIELLRDRRLAEWKRGLARAEDAALDDLASRAPSTSEV